MNVLQEVFTYVLNMSLTASYVVVGVMLVRLLFKKAPRIFMYVLWSAVFFRLVCPVSFTSDLSFFNLVNLDMAQNTGITEYLQYDTAGMPGPAADKGAGSIGDTMNDGYAGLQAEENAGMNSGQTMLGVLSVIWLAGIIVLFFYSVISYVRVKRKLRTATRVKDNIFETDTIDTAFICGFIKPEIYVPVGVSDADMTYIVAHEQIHIKRFDYLIKPFAFLVLIIHWFNPLVWVSFALLSRDIEMSCDESVIRDMGMKAKTGYSGSLLSLAAKKSIPVTGSPLAFGESDVKARIKNILNYRKPAFWVLAAAAIVCCVAVVGLVSNPKVPFDLEKTKAQAMLFTSGEQDLLKVGETAFEHYYSSFMGEDVPEEYRITGYKLNKVALLAGDEKEFCVRIESDYSTTGLYFMSANGSFKPTDAGYECEGNYSEFRIKSLGNDEYQIVSIGTGGGGQGLEPGVEQYLNIIMSSPRESSNPQDYIDAHKQEYRAILALDTEALPYLFREFEKGGQTGLKGHIMESLCRTILGGEDIKYASTDPQDWYDTFKAHIQKIADLNSLEWVKENCPKASLVLVTANQADEVVTLPDFIYDGVDEVEKLVYATETDKYSDPKRGFTVVAPRIFGSYEEGEQLKVFVTTYSATYKLQDHVLSQQGGSVVPAAITYIKGNDGRYILKDYEQARDGADFAESIRKFCTMPVSGSEIAGLADQILDHYGDYEDIRTLHRENLIQHLKAHQQNNVTLYSPSV